MSLGEGSSGLSKNVRSSPEERLVAATTMNQGQHHFWMLAWPEESGQYEHLAPRWLLRHTEPEDGANSRRQVAYPPHPRERISFYGCRTLRFLKGPGLDSASL